MCIICFSGLSHGKEKILPPRGCCQLPLVPFIPEKLSKSVLLIQPLITDSDSLTLQVEWLLLTPIAPSRKLYLHYWESQDLTYLKMKSRSNLAQYPNCTDAKTEAQGGLPPSFLADGKDQFFFLLVQCSFHILSQEHTLLYSALLISWYSRVIFNVLLLKSPS